MRRIRSALLALACSWLWATRAQEAEPVPPEPGQGPELDFLEYLGTWAEEDDEWLAIEEWRKDLGAEEEEEEEEDAEESESEREDDDESE